MLSLSTNRHNQMHIYKYRGNTEQWLVVTYLHIFEQILNTSTGLHLKGELKRLTPAPRITHWPPLHGLPYGLPYGLLHGLPYGLPLRTTLKNQPNYFYGVQKYRKLTCSSYTIITARKTAAIFFSYICRPSLFYFDPFFTGRPPARTHNGRSVSAVEYLSL